jgi:hypothetical protein
VRMTLPLPPKTLVPPTMMAANARKSKPVDIADTAGLSTAARTPIRQGRAGNSSKPLGVLMRS